MTISFPLHSYWVVQYDLVVGVFLQNLCSWAFKKVLSLIVGVLLYFALFCHQHGNYRYCSLPWYLFFLSKMVSGNGPWLNWQLKLFVKPVCHTSSLPAINSHIQKHALNSSFRGFVLMWTVWHHIWWSALIVKGRALSSSSRWFFLQSGSLVSIGGSSFRTIRF